MNIGFFGDSFCSVNDTKKGYDYTTYIKKLEEFYNATIVHLGFKGTSIYDVMLIQLPHFLKRAAPPDVCIFVWTNNNRIFHRDFRFLNVGSVFDCPPVDDAIWDAAKKYYAHLSDEELDTFQYKAALHYFDHEVLSKFPKTTQIIHLWSFEDCGYKWTNGITIPTPLSNVADAGNTSSSSRSWHDTALNHLAGDEKNNIVFSWIKNVIDKCKENTHNVNTTI